jgi:hypothetical protein
VQELDSTGRAQALNRIRMDGIVGEYDLPSRGPAHRC